jgi:hypothetical protein
MRPGEWGFPRIAALGSSVNRGKAALMVLYGNSILGAVKYVKYPVLRILGYQPTE